MTLETAKARLSEVSADLHDDTLASQLTHAKQEELEAALADARRATERVSLFGSLNPRRWGARSRTKAL